MNKDWETGTDRWLLEVGLRVLYLLSKVDSRVVVVARKKNNGDGDWMLDAKMRVVFLLT